MTYRDARPDPPLCPRCGDPAIAWDVMWDWYICASLHEFDVQTPDRHRGCNLPGIEAARPEAIQAHVAAMEAWRQSQAPWWVRWARRGRECLARWLG